MDSTLQLPKRKEFFSSIQEKSISKENHDFAKKVWYAFGVKNLTEYMILYCAIDTLLLAEIFQKFRKTMSDLTGLDASHYISLPGLGWDAMLKITKCEIGLPTDVDMIHFLEGGIRGGVSFINTRYKNVKNEKKKKENPDPAIRYIDANVSIHLLSLSLSFSLSLSLFILFIKLFYFFTESLWTCTTWDAPVWKL